MDKKFCRRKFTYYNVQKTKNGSMSKAISKVQLKAIVDVITKLYPASYADGSWDNTGLLIDCSAATTNVTKPKVLLTVDLTTSVAQEAIDKNCNFILAYHPFIFPSWKKLSPWTNPQHDSAIKLIQHGISVYCPHTAVDAAKNGVNDWLVTSLCGGDSSLIHSSVSIEKVDPQQGEEEHEVGYGRIVKFSRPYNLDAIIQSAKKSLGIEHLQVATKHTDLSQHMIQTVALCAGSGSGVFRNLRESVDLYFTGELSHHEVLKYREMGKAVITCNHSNTERGYLKAIMQDALKRENIDCEVSASDCDPLRVV